MNTSIKSISDLAFTAIVFATIQSVQAQTLAKNEAWLEKTFDQLIKDKKDNETPTNANRYLMGTHHLLAIKAFQQNGPVTGHGIHGR